MLNYTQLGEESIQCIKGSVVPQKKQQKIVWVCISAYVCTHLLIKRVSIGKRGTQKLDWWDTQEKLWWLWIAGKKQKALITQCEVDVESCSLGVLWRHIFTPMWDIYFQTYYIYIHEFLSTVRPSKMLFIWAKKKRWRNLDNSKW